MFAEFQLSTTCSPPWISRRKLLRVPLAGGMVFRTSGAWPRTKAIYCYPVDAEDWPDEPEIVDALGAVLRAPRRGDRPGARPCSGEPLSVGVHHRARP